MARALAHEIIDQRIAGTDVAGKRVQQAIDQSSRIEAKINELRTLRRELQVKFKNNLDLFQRLLEAEMEDERNTGTVLTLPRKRREA